MLYLRTHLLKLPYLPRGTTTIAAIGQTHAIDLPYISSLDLFVFMVISHDMGVKTPKPLKEETPDEETPDEETQDEETKDEETKDEKTKDEIDVKMLQHFLRHLKSIGPVIFSPQQKESLTHGLNWLTTYSQWSEAQWIRKLDL